MMIFRIPGAKTDGVWGPSKPLPTCPWIVFDGTDYLCYDAKEEAPTLYKPAGDTRTAAQFAVDMRAELVADKLRSVAPTAGWIAVTEAVPVINGHQFMKQVPARADCLLRSVERPNAFRFELAPGDICVAIDGPAARVERSELSCFTKLAFGVPYVVSYALTMFDTGIADPASAGWVVMGQLHQTEDKVDAPASPIFAREVTPQRHRAYNRRTSAQNPLLVSPPSSYFMIDRTPRWGVTIAVREEHCIDPVGSGYHRVYHDDVLVASYAGPTGYVDAVGPYYKFGIYRAADASHTLIVEVADFTLVAA